MPIKYIKQESNNRELSKSIKIISKVFVMMIREMRIADLNPLHKMYERLSEESKRFFHPGFLGYDNISFGWVLYQIILIFSCIKPIRRVLKRFFPKLVILSLVGVEKKEIVAFGYLKINRRLNNKYYQATLGICVDEAFRGKGLGSKLMRSLIETAKKENICEIVLTVLSDNKIAISLYEKNGFKKIGQTLDRWKGKTFESMIMVLNNKKI